MKNKKIYKEKFSWFYNSKAWKDLRNRKWVDTNGICELCKKEGKIKIAREVHHIIPIEENFSKALEYNNLLSLCSKHHNEMHNRIPNIKKFLEEWDKI